jgi:hypothetical protein
MKIRFLVCLLIAILLCVAPSIGATTLARLSIDQLARAADAVARVSCISAQSRWENGEIWTVMSFNIVETMKGALPSRITVRLPGGRVGHLNAAVDGTPRFSAGDEAVVFLERYRAGLEVGSGLVHAGEFSVAAWVEGTFRIGRDPRTGIENVTQDSSTFAVFDTATRTFHTEGIRRMPIEQFRDRVAAAITRTQEKIQ